ncbi:MAG: hypothetical protein MUE72_11610 [Chitinophagaceae bacterium]|jgi:hypothetical protein|nr:hypothetical protein [Chitinophagaceae bacterium]
MNNLIEQYELVKEIKFIFENIEPSIIGRIYKVVKGPNSQYMWTISHYCRQEGRIEAYIPSSQFGQTLKETEHRLLQYIQSFETAIDWIDNHYF